MTRNSVCAAQLINFVYFQSCPTGFSQNTRFKNPSLLLENPQATVNILVVLYVNDLADALTIGHLVYSNNVKNAQPSQSSLGANSK